ncbi:MAG: pantetheine-phosphate adenylyltransferase [Candidatus Pacebacteria bacterium]|nr:pantetheine-phosphate adenylyltransferase [Candidatus Paceibacterota bacterium]
MKTRKAVYAASLDPITNGHVNIIERMAPLYDELVVLVAVDPRKNYTFSQKDRVEMARNSVTHLQNVSVDTCVGQYVVKKAQSLGAQVVIRGLRNFKDLEDEQTLAEENRRICPEIETVWVPCLPNLMHVSSSMVRSHVGADPGWEEQAARSVPEVVVMKLKEKFVLGKAKRHWGSLMSSFGYLKGSEAVLDILLGRYTETHRHYHNLEHVVSMLDELGTLNDPDKALSLAIWFHDAVYDPKAKDNEEQSAKLAKSLLKKLGLSDELGNRVHDLILATKHVHMPSDPVARTLVDLDLMILGKPEKEFDVYEAGIRQEYGWVVYPDFYEGRSKILQSFLDRPSIFSTDQFQAKYEIVARDNLERSIIKLRG